MSLSLAHPLLHQCSCCDEGHEIAVSTTVEQEMCDQAGLMIIMLEVSEGEEDEVSVTFDNGSHILFHFVDHELKC